MTADDGALRLGPGVVQLLLPHRRPFLMVDGVSAYRRAPSLELEAYRLISANEEVFEGHFPGVPLWPGVYTIEGLGQSINVALVIEALQAAFEERGATAEDVLRLLRNEQLGASFHPGHDAEVSAFLREATGAVTSRFGMSAAVDVKLLEPVFAGQRIDYRVRRTHALGRLERFEVWAGVEGRPVAKGVMSSVRLGGPPGGGRA